MKKLDSQTLAEQLAQRPDWRFDIALARLIDQAFSRFQSTPVLTCEGRDDVATPD